MRTFLLILLCTCFVACNQSSTTDDQEEASDNALSEYVSSPLDEAKDVDRAHQERADKLDKMLDDIDP